jgi:hypothetical protein
MLGTLGIAHDAMYGVYANRKVMWRQAAHEDGWI